LIEAASSTIPGAVAGGVTIPPKRVRAGDVVGVVAPAGPIEEPRLHAGIAMLEELGLRPRLGNAVLQQRGHLAGSDAARLADLTAMIGDPDVRAILCARGGYGSQRIVPELDFDALRADPKPIVGYSDVTALLGAALGEGVGGFHGPMVATDMARGLSARSLACFWSALSDPDARLDAPVPTRVRPGRARGRLVGGCLSVVVSTLGTPWGIDAAGAILFLEDVNEWPFRIDRLLLQLRQAGVLDRVAGVVFGTLATCKSARGVAPLDVIREAFADVPYPVGFGVPAGHESAESDVENLTLPLGTMVELDVEAGRLVALEPAVV
jgi:muramoyltetrapeptide carboxypeptidase